MNKKKVALIETVLQEPLLFEEKELPQGVLCRVTYPVCNIGVKNQNNRIYRKDVWEKVLKDNNISRKLRDRTLFGHAEHPETTQSNLEKTSHIVSNLWIDEKENKVKATLDVLDTPYGRIIDTLLKAGSKVGVSTRADGELKEEIDEEGNKYYDVVPEAYRFVTVDFTADPSTFEVLPERVDRNLVQDLKAGIESKKIDADFALALCEKLNTPEAMALVESIKKEKEGEEVKETIKKEGSKWVVYSKSGKKMGTYDTEKEAKRRLRQIEYFKRRKNESVSEAVDKIEIGKLYHIVKPLEVLYFKWKYPSIEEKNIGQLREECEDVETLGIPDTVSYLYVNDIVAGKDGEYVLAAENLTEGEKIQPSSKHLYVIPIEVLKDSVKLVSLGEKRQNESLSREEWEVVEEAVGDVAVNFKKITGVDPVDTIDPEGSFKQEIIDKTADKVEEYVKKKYEMTEEMYEEFLYKLDDEMLDRYADEAMERYYREHPEAKESVKEGVEKYTDEELAKELAEIPNRLAACSDTPDGRKARKEIEAYAKKLDAELEKRKKISECIVAWETQDGKVQEKEFESMEEAEKFASSLIADSNVKSVEVYYGQLEVVETIKDEGSPIRSKKLVCSECGYHEEFKEGEVLCPVCEVKLVAKSGIIEPLSEQWETLPRGWTKKSLEKFARSLTGKTKGDTEGFVRACELRMEGKVDDPAAFCASLKDKYLGRTTWRGPRESLEIGIKEQKFVARGIEKKEDAEKLAREKKGVVSQDPKDQKKFAVVVEEGKFKDMMIDIEDDIRKMLQDGKSNAEVESEILKKYGDYARASLVKEVIGKVSAELLSKGIEEKKVNESDLLAMAKFFEEHFADVPEEVKKKIGVLLFDSKAKEIKELEIKLAETTAERDKVLEEFQNLERAYASEVLDLSESISKVKAEKDKLLEELKKEKEKIVEQLSKEKEQLKEQIDRGKVELKQVQEKFEQEKKELERSFVKKYIDKELRESGLDSLLTGSTRALLNECASIEEVDTVIDRVRDAIREGALHSGANLKLIAESGGQEESPLYSRVETIMNAMRGKEGK